VEEELKVTEFEAIRISPTPNVEFEDTNTDHEIGLEPVPLPVLLVIMKLPLTVLFAAVPDQEIPETEYVGPATVTWLVDTPVPIIAASAAWTRTMM
jgi:hypothetical protein